jgi:hypothetical protein
VRREETDLQFGICGRLRHRSSRLAESKGAGKEDGADDFIRDTGSNTVIMKALDQNPV